ncbi:MAG: DUF4465 domain-containing protein [Bacteroidota bacterium]|nr:DUF4465 domain-containing protein [Bacteroidota bacterium]
MMKKHMKIAVIAGIFLAGMTNGKAQQVADFENLNLAPESYYDGGADHSGTEYATEFFTYQSGGVNFSVNHTDWGGGSNSFGGMAYSNLSDTVTADYTNFSAYANPDNTSTYGIFYPSWEVSDSIAFGETANLQSFKIANHVWTYHYIMGSDGSGNGTFETNDYLTLTVTAFNDVDENIGTLDIALADYTEGNSDVINNWTSVDLSSIENVSYIKFSMSSSDTMCPTYFCMDDLTYTTATGIESNKTSIAVYPNPINDFVNIDNAQGGSYQLVDSYGRVLVSREINENTQRISTAHLASGMYIIQINYQSQQIVKKIIK